MKKLCLLPVLWPTLLLALLLQFVSFDPDGSGANQKQKKPSKTSRISYTLWRNNSFTNRFSPYYACREPAGRLHHDMQDTLNFTSKIKTNLNILFLGDSVGVQLAQSFQEAAGVINRTIYRYSWGLHEGLFVGDTNEGGTVTGWRILGLLSRKGEKRPLPNRPGGGWRRSDARDLLNHTVNDVKIGSIDVMVVRIPHGWIPLSSVTTAALNESVTLANELYGVKKLIFLTMHLNNNILTQDDWDDLNQRNEMLKAFSRKNHSVVDSILVLDFARLEEDLVSWNADLLGMNTTNKTDYVFKNLIEKRNFANKIAQVCNPANLPNGYKDCKPSEKMGNGFTRDGMHFCSESLNGRLNGGLACMIQCFDDNDIRDDGGLRSCEKRCNDRFMSLIPVRGFVDYDESYESFSRRGHELE